MNKIEKQMGDILIKIKNECGIAAVKAEFEAEGTRTEELLRLLEIARKSEVNVALKIGGCEAIRDLIEAKQFGVDYIIAPMVETAYALEKFIEAKNKIYNEDDRKDVSFLVNIETVTGYNNRIDMVNSATQKNGIQGLVFGRVDYVGSLKLSRNDVETLTVTNAVKDVSKVCKDNNLELVVGGAISRDSIESLKSIQEIHLSRFETRKIVFPSSSLNGELLKNNLIDAIHFELLWLINKREFYKTITNEDDKRIEMLNNRWNILKEA